MRDLNPAGTAALVLAAAVLLGFANDTTAAPVRQHDVVILGGTMVDGTGAAPRRADIAIAGGRIVAVGDLSTAAESAGRVIDATGLHVFPGFIDTHSHAAGGLAREDLKTGHALLAQGITTVMVNPDGGGPVDMAEQRLGFESRGVGVNIAQLVPHGSVRRAVMGMQDREATGEELDRMRELVATGMREGAFGLSSGLYYSPGSWAPTSEVIELSKIAAQFGGAYQSHIRDESDYNIGLIAAVDEVIEISREAGITGVVTHVKALGPRVWGQGAEIVRRIDAARAEGLEVYADQYPYEASGTGIVGALVPRWALAGAEGAFEARLASPRERARLVAEMRENLDRRGGADRLVLQGGPHKGITIAEVAGQRGLDPVETALALLVESQERGGGGTGLTSFNMAEEDIETLMAAPWTMTSSDGTLWAPGEGNPHPRGFGAFPRRIRKYVMEKGIGTVPQAVHAMSGLPARVYHIAARGVLAEGIAADIVVVDLDRFRDTATYDNPHGHAEGVVFAFVNDEAAIDDGHFTDALGGRVLTR